MNIGKLAAAVLFMAAALIFLGQTGCGKVNLTNPVISGFMPQHGVAGTNVTIGGSRFSPTAANNVVKFNGVQATVVSATATQIVATVPAGATTGPITVTTSDGIGSSTTNFVVANLIGGSVQGITLSLAGSVTTVAGTAGVAGSTDGTGAAALFLKPFGLATDGITLFITDQGNQTIRSMDIASGAVTTIAGTAGVPGSANGAGSTALFNAPAGITVTKGILYICDSLNNTIRQMVLSTGQVSTLAGSAGVAGSADGTGSAARFNVPQGITTDGTFLYVCDSGNNTIRRVDPASGTVITIAGSAIFSGSVDGTGTAALFKNPIGISTNGSSLFITDQNNQSVATSPGTLRLLTIATSSVVTIAGSPVFSGTTDGPGFLALFNLPSGITTDGGLLYVSDSQNQTIRIFIPTSAGQFNNGQVVTLAGSALGPGSADGTGTAARFNLPKGITTDGNALFVADSSNNTIRKIQ